jgi:DNA polymerase type B, organellar and viral
MSENTGHYLKPARRVTTPAVVFSIVVETEDIPQRKTDVYQERVFRSCVATVTKKRRGKWSIPLVLETSDCDELREWVHSNADTRRRNYVICPIASDVLTLTKWWSYASVRTIKYEARDANSDSRSKAIEECSTIVVRRAVLRGKPDIFDYVDDGKRYLWISGSQYLDNRERYIGESIGYREQSDLFTISQASRLGYTTLDRALMWSQFLCHLSNWWSECATAPFGLTVGALSMGILRTYIKPKTLSTHKDEYAHKIERYACYGGRASVWYVGAVGTTSAIPLHRVSVDRQCTSESISGPVRLVDVRSMYPHLLASQLFPCRYAGRIGTISPSELLSLASHYGIIASCTIYSYSGEYPYRTKARLTYPRGYIQTVLTSPEILALTGRDVLVKVHDGAMYTMGEPFKEAAQSLLDMRVAARKAKNGAWELFAKAVGNNLGGKLAQRRTIWKQRTDVYPEREWGEWIVTNHDTATATRYRSICGLVSEYVRDPGGYGPYTPAFAFLTAYGRLHMRRIRSLCPQHSVIAQDTDGIWIVGDEAYNILRSRAVFGDGPGELAIKAVTQNSLFLGPRHYWTDAGWVLSGFHDHSFDTDKMIVTDSYSQNPVSIGTRSAPVSLITRKRESALVLDHVGGEIQPDGWVRPTWYDPPKDYVV